MYTSLLSEHLYIISKYIMNKYSQSANCISPNLDDPNETTTESIILSAHYL
jgi:hypothetical protein